MSPSIPSLTLFLYMSFWNLELIYFFIYFLFSTQELLTETENLKPTYKEVTSLSKPIIEFLGEVHQSSALALQARLDKLTEQYKM